MNTFVRIAGLAAVAALIVTSATAGTLADVRARGVLRCGVRVDAPGFAYVDDKGVTRGFDVELCHALAAAVLIATSVPTRASRSIAASIASGKMEACSSRLLSGEARRS